MKKYKYITATVKEKYLGKWRERVIVLRCEEIK